MGPRLALLKNFGFSLYLLTCFLSTFGSGLSYITANWLILTVKNDVMSVLVMMICFWFPSALLGPYWGVIVDRYSRKRLLIISNSIRCVILLSTAYVIYHFKLSVVVLDVLMLLLGCLFGVMLPAQIAFVRELVNPQELLYANTSIDIMYEVGNVIGMASAGFLLTVASPAVAFLINGCLFLLAAIVLIFIPMRGSKEKLPKRSAVNDFVLGLHYLSGDKVLALIYMIQLLILAAFMITPVLIAPFAKNILHATAGEFSLIEAALSFGVIIGGLSLPLLVRKFGFNNTLFYLTLSLAILFVLFSFNTSLLASGVLYCLIGFVLSSWPLVVTKAQDRTEFSFQGRVQSVFSSVSAMLVLVTYLVIALGAHVIPLHFLYLFPALLAILSLFLIWRLRHQVKE